MTGPDPLAIEALAQARVSKQVLSALIGTLYLKGVLTDTDRRQLQRKLK